MSPGHDRLALETLDHGVWVLDLASKEITLRIPGHEWRTSGIAWSQDGSRLALLGVLGDLEIVDAVTGQLTAAWKTKAGTPFFAAGGLVVAVGLGPGPTELWPVRGGERIAEISVREGQRTTALALSRDGELIALGDEDGGVGLWSARTGRPRSLVVQLPPGGREKAVLSLDFDPRAETLAIGSGDCYVRLWEIESARPMRKLSQCEQNLTGNMAIGCVRFSADGRRLLSTSHGFWEACLWTLASGDAIRAFDYGGGSPCRMPAWLSSDGDWITTALNRRTMRVSDPSSMRRPSPTNGKDWIWYRSDGDLIWAVVDHYLQVWRVSEDEPFVKLRVAQPFDDSPEALERKRPERGPMR
jgi:WD40 repeat protein